MNETFVHGRILQSQLFKYHPAYARLRDSLFKDHKNTVFARTMDGENVISFEATLNALLHLFTEAGVKLLFSKPELMEEQLQRANEFAYVACNDRECKPFDLQTTLVIHYIQLMYPVQNNRRQARQRDIERFITRELQPVWSDAYAHWLLELLFAQDYANQRTFITFFRFTA